MSVALAVYGRMLGWLFINSPHLRVGFLPT